MGSYRWVQSSRQAATNATAGAKEFKSAFDEAVTKNTELLGEDPAGEGEAAEPSEPSPADKLASQAENLKVKDDEPANGKQ